MNAAAFGISHHITGNHPTRAADLDDRAAPGFVVAFQRGFEQLRIAVYGAGLTASDAEAAAVEWLEKHAPAALTATEREERAAADVFPLPVLIVCRSACGRELSRQHVPSWARAERIIIARNRAEISRNQIHPENAPRWGIEITEEK